MGAGRALTLVANKCWHHGLLICRLSTLVAHVDSVVHRLLLLVLLLLGLRVLHFHRVCVNSVTHCLLLLLLLGGMAQGLVQLILVLLLFINVVLIVHKTVLSISIRSQITVGLRLLRLLSLLRLLWVFLFLTLRIEALIVEIES